MDHLSLSDDWDAHWQELSKDIYFNTPAVKYRWKCIERLLALDPSTLSSIKLMDIGCGTGNLLQYFLNNHEGIHAKGTDNSLVGLKIAQKKMPQAEFFQADLCAQSQDFSAHQGWATHALCSEVLEHLDDPILFLKNISTFLKKGASLVISVPGGPMSSFDHQVGHRKHYTANLLKSELEQAGYKVEKTVCAGFPFHNVYRLAFIARGASIMKDVKRQEHNNRFISLVMQCFRFLFKFNLFNSPFGWTVLAKASKPE